MKHSTAFILALCARCDAVLCDQHLVYIQVLIKKQKQDVAALQQAPAGAPAGVSCYKATLSTPVAEGKTVEFDVVATITGVYRPHPSEIRQGEKQYVEYIDNMYLLSPYTVDSQTTNVSSFFWTALATSAYTYY